MKIYINSIFKNKKEEALNEIKEETNENLDIKIAYEKNIEKERYIRKGAKTAKSINFNIKKNKNNKDKLNNDNNKENKKFKLNKYNLPKSYYALLIFMFLLAGVSIYMLNIENNNALEEDYAVFNNQTDNLNDNKKNDVYEKNEGSFQNESSNNIDTRGECLEINSNSSSNVIAKVQQKVNNIIEKKEEPLIFAKPLNGEILKIFSNDKVIYSKTLEMWKTHDGIDIKGNEGDIVYSIERGTVEKIYEDAFYGITIVINHGQGYKSSYSNLSEDTFVNVGDNIKKSQKIGKIGTTAIGEIKDLPHLHFMLYGNNIVIDPSSIFE